MRNLVFASSLLLAACGSAVAPGAPGDAGALSDGAVGTDSTSPDADRADVVSETGSTSDSGAEAATSDGLVATDTMPPPVPLGKVAGTYFVSCLPTLAGDDASKSLLFYGEVKVLGTTAGAQRLELQLTPFVETATKMDIALTVGGTETSTTEVVGTDAKWTAVLGEWRIPGNSQRIGDSNLRFANASLEGLVLADGNLCAEMQGKLVDPFEVDFDAPGDHCIWRRVAEGADLPHVTGVGGGYVGYLVSEHRCP
jgi:hypothetical protein